MDEHHHLKISFSNLKDFFNKEKLKNYLRRILTLKSKPSKIALSIALGVFVGLLIPIGLQTLIVVPIGLLLGCNVILATTATFISNPITMFPIYYAAFKVGEFVTSIEISWQAIYNIIDNPNIDNIITLGSEGIIVFFSGGFIIGAITAAITYFLALRTILAYRIRKNIPIDPQ
ncbi:MAG: DUF2062 domain-containing protein [Ignavibacteria bacterium]|jgi:uncharacterized protein (DUF2062 family)